MALKVALDNDFERYERLAKEYDDKSFEAFMALKNLLNIKIDSEAYNLLIKVSLYSEIKGQFLARPNREQVTA